MYSCVYPGCPGNHASKWFLCDPEPSLKVVFLDIDGVLNSLNWAKSGGGYGRPPLKGPPTREALKWDPAAVAALRKIIERTGAKIVVSSSWRGFGDKAVDSWQAMFGCYGWPDAPVIGETPFLEKKLPSGLYVTVKRGEEVATWLNTNPGVSKFICIDDDSDFLLGQELIRTSHEEGLTDDLADLCIECLSDSGDGKL